MYTFASSFLPSTMPHKDEEKPPYLELKKDLESAENSRIVAALHKLSRMRMSSKQRAFLFPTLVSLVASPSLEVKGAAYSFVSRIVLGDRSLLLLSTNMILKELKYERGYQEPPEERLRRVLALEFISKTDDPEFLGHFEEALRDGLSSQIQEVRRAALLALPSFCRAFGECHKEEITRALESKNFALSGRALRVLVETEKTRPGTWPREELAHYFSWMCANRAGICDGGEDFSRVCYDFVRVLKAKAPLRDTDLPILTAGVAVLPFVKFYVVRELLSFALPCLTLALSEALYASLVSFLGTSDKRDALGAIPALLSRSGPLRLDPAPFFLDASDTREEKKWKIRILSLISDKGSVEEIRSSLYDQHCVFYAVSSLISTGAARKEDIRKALGLHPEAALLALYKEFPFDALLYPTVAKFLGSLFNVRQKEPFLYLAGHILDHVPDEAKRISRIKKGGKKILYGNKEERDQAEEHLEEYVYFLVNLLYRGAISEEECAEEGDRALDTEPFLKRKFLHLLEMVRGGNPKVREVIGYKRVGYRVEGCKDFADQ